jgi:copper homeostasis protein
MGGGMDKRIVLEVCVDSVEAAMAAQEGGADRVELCADLLEGGITPSGGAIQLACERLGIPVNVIIRPRGGDFCYSDVEFEGMKRNIDLAMEAGANGVVIGILNADGTVDVERTGALVERARPLSVTYHRAFDVARDPYQALEALIGLGIDRVLTSGQEPSVLEGLDLIVDLVRAAGERIVVMPGGGVTERNVAKIVAASGVKEIHVAAPVAVESRMQYRNPRVYMGGELRPPEYTIAMTDAERIRAFRQAVE